MDNFDELDGPVISSVRKRKIKTWNLFLEPC